MRRWEVITTHGVVTLQAETWLADSSGVLYFFDADQQPIGPFFSMHQVVQWRALSP